MEEKQIIDVRGELKTTTSEIPTDLIKIKRLPDNLGEAYKDIVARKGHNEWRAVRQEHGWTPGFPRNNDMKVHPSNLPYDLIEDIQYYSEGVSKEIFFKLAETHRSDAITTVDYFSQAEFEQLTKVVNEMSEENFTKWIEFIKNVSAKSNDNWARNMEDIFNGLEINLEGEGKILEFNDLEKLVSLNTKKIDENIKNKKIADLEYLKNSMVEFSGFNTPQEMINFLDTNTLLRKALVDIHGGWRRQVNEENKVTYSPATYENQKIVDLLENKDIVFLWGKIRTFLLNINKESDKSETFQGRLSKVVDQERKAFHETNRSAGESFALMLGIVKNLQEFAERDINPELKKACINVANDLFYVIKMDANNSPVDVVMELIKEIPTAEKVQEKQLQLAGD